MADIQPESHISDEKRDILLNTGNTLEKEQLHGLLVEYADEFATNSVT